VTGACPVPIQQYELLCFYIGYGSTRFTTLHRGRRTDVATARSLFLGAGAVAAPLPPFVRVCVCVCLFVCLFDYIYSERHQAAVSTAMAVVQLMQLPLRRLLYEFNCVTSCIVN
jgi:hypothetical protein